MKTGEAAKLSRRLEISFFGEERSGFILVAIASPDIAHEINAVVLGRRTLLPSREGARLGLSCHSLL
jgi:hypothetical protein